MKCILSSLALLFYYYGTAQVQMPLNDNKEIEYTEVVLAGQVSSNQLLHRAKHFAKSSKSFGEAKHDNKQFSCIYTTDLWGEHFYQKLTLNCEIKIEVKEGKYKYSVCNFTYRPVPTSKNPQPLTVSGNTLYNDYLLLVNTGKTNNKKAKNSEAIFQLTDKKVREMIDSLKTAMNEIVTEEDDW